MEEVILNNGVNMPIEGYGTYRLSPDITVKCVMQALDLGYRSIDTAQCYGNEKEVGEACRNSGISREDIFITTKLWNCQNHKGTQKSISSSLKSLDLEYIDLLLIHEPHGDVHQIYKAMEEVYRKNYVRAIGVSNFLKERYLDLVQKCDVTPAVNQVETHIFRQQEELIKIEREYGTHPESWSPLAAGMENIFQHPVLISIAEELDKTPAQIALRFLVQQDIIVIPKSVNPERMKENLDIFDFHLTIQEMEELFRLERGRSLFNWW